MEEDTEQEEIIIGPSVMQSLNCVNNRKRRMTQNEQEKNAKLPKAPEFDGINLIGNNDSVNLVSHLSMSIFFIHNSPSSCTLLLLLLLIMVRSST